ncbi:unnamed protein product [Trichogramma brassicae]|uniref:Uncharacterized protein n=1 Tax=Trichogramma brassicae TaxID=86971 RepID=A0A6H5I966_9HYME|nr:unnamed protein product [Trichogramma brassicae]
MFCETLLLYSIIANKRITQISAKLRINQNPHFYVYITHVSTDALTRRKEERCSRRVLATYTHIKLTLVRWIVTTEGYHSGLWAWFIKEDSMATGTSIQIFPKKRWWCWTLVLVVAAAQLAINVEKFGEKRRKINRRYRRPQLAAAYWLTVIYSNRDRKLQPDISAVACLLTITISTTRVCAHVPNQRRASATAAEYRMRRLSFRVYTQLDTRVRITTASTTTRTETRTRTTTRRTTKRRLMMQRCAKKQSSGHPRRGLLPAADDAPPSPAAGRVPMTTLPMRRRPRRRLHLSARRLARPYHHTASESRGFEIATTRAAAQQRRSRRSSFADNPHEHAGAPHKYTYKYIYISISHTRARTSREFRVSVRS